MQRQMLYLRGESHSHSAGYITVPIILRGDYQLFVSTVSNASLRTQAGAGGWIGDVTLWVGIVGTRKVKRKVGGGGKG